MQFKNFVIGSKYIYVTQHDYNNRNDTLLSRCTITGIRDSEDNSIIAECKNGDYMTLEDFGHGESLAMATYNNSTYFYVEQQLMKPKSLKNVGLNKYQELNMLLKQHWIIKIPAKLDIWIMQTLIWQVWEQ